MLNRLNQYINDYCIYRCDPNKKYSPQLPNGQMPRKNMVIKEGLNTFFQTYPVFEFLIFNSICRDW